MVDRVHIDPDRVYSVSIAARFLGVSPSTLRDLARRGLVACTRTPGGQRRFAGADLLRLQDESIRRPSKPARPTSSSGAATPEEAQARQAWLGALIARVQRELPLDTPAEIRLRLGAELERALRDLGPASPCDAVDPLVKSLIDRATRQTRDAQEDARRRETKGLLLEYALAHLRRSIDALPKHMVGAPGSPRGRHVRATLRERLRDQLQKRLTGAEPWHEVRDLVEEFVAAWYVEQPSDRRIPDAVKLLAAGMTGAAGGAAAAAALDPRIRAGVAKLTDRLLSRAAELAKRFRTPPPSAAPSPNPASPAVTRPWQPGPWIGLVGSWPPSYRKIRRHFPPVTAKSQEVAPDGATPCDSRATPPAAPDREDASFDPPGPSSPTS